MIKIIVFLVVAAAAAIGYWQFGDALTLENLASKETALREAKANAPLLVFSIGFLIYVLVTGLSLPGAAVLTIASGWFFGLWQGTLLVSFASTTGATLAFLFSRYLFRDTIQRRFVDRLEKFNAALEKEGPFYLFTLRLIPAVPFFVLNLVMGGDCLNVGCVPSKAIISAARSAAAVRDAGEFGVNVQPGTEVDFGNVMERMRKLRSDISPHDSVKRFESLGIDVFLGQGEFIDSFTISVGDAKLKFAKAVIWTGARASAPPIDGLNTAEAKKQNIEIDTFTQPMSGVDRAILEGETEGFVRVHVKKGSDKIVGATIVAQNAGDMIGSISIAMTQKIGLGSIANCIHPYPTQAEAIRKVGDLYNKTRLTPFVAAIMKKVIAWQG